MPVVSISDAQRAPLPRRLARRPSITACRATCSRSTPSRGRLPGVPRPDLAARSGLDRAIEIAAARRHAAEDRRQGRPGRPRLLRAARSSRCSTSRCVEFIGEIGERGRTRSSAARAALLFPIDWPEPFGLVMIEAHGLRHAGRRVPRRLGAGGHRRRRHRLRRRRRRGGGRGATRAAGARSRAAVRDASSERFTRGADGRAATSTVYER